MKETSRFLEIPGAIAEIYVPSYQDSNGDGIGDLKGLERRLGYLQDLGVGAVKLSPIWQSPWKDNGYDPSDHLAIDPRFGTMKDFQSLIDAAHERGIGIITDFIASHTSDKHAWFKESSSSKDNPKADWFIWADSPNNWISQATGESAWEWNPLRKQYYYHNFLVEQPALNWRNREVRRVMIEEVLPRSLEMGAIGSRGDAIRYMIVDEERRDEPENPNYNPDTDNPYNKLLHTRTRDQEEIFPILREMSDVVSGFPNAFMIGETYIDSNEGKRKYYDAADPNVHALYDFDLIFTPYNARAVKAAIENYLTILKPGEFAVSSVGNHDRDRLISRVGGEAQAGNVAIIQATMPQHISSIYYGDEIGMPQVNVPPELRRDTFVRNRDGARTLMQWDSSANAGFTEEGVKPVFPLGPNYEERNVEAQEETPDSLLKLYRRLYKDLPQQGSMQDILRKGNYKAFENVPEPVYAFSREYDGEKAIVIANFSGEQVPVSLDVERAKVLVDSSLRANQGEVVDLRDIVLAPHEGIVFQSQ